MKPGQLRVVRYHGVVVDDQMDVMAFQTLPLHVVDQLVALHGVFLAVHFHVDGGKALAGAVIVNHQVVISQNLGLGADVVHDTRLKFGGGSFAKQGTDGLLRQLGTAVENEQRHGQTHEAVNGQPGNGLDDGGQQDGGGGDDVVAAVLGGCEQSGGVDFPAQRPVEQAQPQLDGDGQHQHRRQRGGKHHRHRGEDFPHGGLCQLEADNDDHGGDHQTGQVFKPGVAVGMFRVGGLLGKLESHQRHDGAGRVGQVVHGVGGDGNRAGQGADDDLSQKKEKIAENAHDPGQSTHSGAHLGIADLVGVFNKETEQKLCHNPASYRKSVHSITDSGKKKGHFTLKFSEKPPGYRFGVSGSDGICGFYSQGHSAQAASY